PAIPEAYRDSEFIFLANIDPELQLDVLEQIRSPKLVALDTMNYWIEGSLPRLRTVLKKVDALIVNDSEARQLAEDPNLVKAAKRIYDMGPHVVIIKKGEHGALMFAEEGMFWAPAFLMEHIHDPTGAGDTFAGGFIGYLAWSRKLSHDNLKRALVFGGTMASFTVERFSLERLQNLTHAEIRHRVEDFWHMTQFDHENSGF
ncbi:PfkB family carbohydrate kinase, partial [bacterium]|nr:PfkB family carbohydrate kinase [bacterium]